MQENDKVKFNQKEYILDYKKKNYKKFVVDLKIKDFDELEEILSERNLTKAQFLKNSIEELKKSS